MIMADHVWHFAATAFFVAAVEYCASWDFLYGRCKQLFVSELNNAYFFKHLF